jgi:DNA polymerase
VNIRDENVLRELNLYPLWVRRGTSVADAPEVSVPVAETQAACRLGGGEADTQQSAMGIAALNPSYVSSLDWNELKQTVRDCTACKLRAGCTQTVFGVGDEKAEWLFVGEGPGADEDAQGEPFVGQAGKLLDNMLAAIKLKRGNNVYIANIVKCRPPGNRTPEADEIASCLPYLQQQIALIKPKLIVALGKTAATSLLGREATLGSLRGAVHDFQLAPATGSDVDQGGESSRRQPLPHQTTSSHRVGVSIPLIVTYHPAYLLRSPAEKAKAWQDLCFAVQRMTV